MVQIPSFQIWSSQKKITNTLLPGYPDSYFRLDVTVAPVFFKSVKQGGSAAVMATGQRGENYGVVRSTVRAAGQTPWCQGVQKTPMADGHASAWPGPILTQLCLAWSTWLLVNQHTHCNDMAPPTARRGSSPWTDACMWGNAVEVNAGKHIYDESLLRKTCLHLRSTCDRVHCCSYFTCTIIKLQFNYVIKAKEAAV